MGLPKKESPGAKRYPDGVCLRKCLYQIIREGVKLFLAPYRNHFQNGSNNKEEQAGKNHREMERNRPHLAFFLTGSYVLSCNSPIRSVLYMYWKYANSIRVSARPK